MRQAGGGRAHIYEDPEYSAVRRKLHQELERLRAELEVSEDGRGVKTPREKRKAGA